jgi:hypothetical protein
MLPDKKTMCPYTGFAKSCFEGVTEHACPKWTHILGMHPQTGETLDKFGCSDSFLPLLLIENSRKQSETGAAVESFRNEMVRLNGSLNGRLLDAGHHRS